MTTILKLVFCCFLTLIMTFPGYSQTAEEYYKKGEEKLSRKDFPGALADYNLAIELNPHFAPAWFSRGNVKVNLQDPDGAISAYSRVLEVNPDNVKILLYRGNAKRAMSRFTGSGKCFFQIRLFQTPVLPMMPFIAMKNYF